MLSLHALADAANHTADSYEAGGQGIDGVPRSANGNDLLREYLAGRCRVIRSSDNGKAIEMLQLPQLPVPSSSRLLHGANSRFSPEPPITRSVR